MIKPELEFVYEAGGELEPPREIGKVVDGTRRIIPITAGGYVKGPKISGKLMGNSADWQLSSGPKKVDGPGKSAPHPPPILTWILVRGLLRSVKN